MKARAAAVTFGVNRISSVANLTDILLTECEQMVAAGGERRLIKQHVIHFEIRLKSAERLDLDAIYWSNSFHRRTQGDPCF